MSEIPRIAMELHGSVAEETASAIREEIASCYQALTVPLPEAVILSLFDTVQRWQDYAARIREEVGVVTAGEEGFLATHEAWMGVPRLNVCLERLLAQAWLLQQGALRQVVAHSVLHGAPEYYRFTVPKAFVEFSEARGVEMEVLQQVLYFVATAVKGYEACSLLVEHGYLEDQMALVFYQLEADEDDLAIWKMARWEPRARLLYLAAQLRPLLYLRPLLAYAPMLLQAGRARLSHLPPEEVEHLEEVIDTFTLHRKGNTHWDVALGLGLVLECL